MIIKIEVKSIYRDDPSDIMFSYCRPEEIVSEFERLHSIHREVVDTHLTDEFGRYLNERGELA